MITRENFIRIMKALQESAERADKLEDAINPIIADRTTVNGPICFAEMFCDWKMESDILEILSDELNDEKDQYGQTWIDYFVYELDWGKKWSPGYVTDAAGADIPMGTPGDLYDYLTDGITIKKIKELCEKCGQ